MGVEVGRLVAGKYELVRPLGRGSMGEVWAAKHRALGDHVALKLLKPEAAVEEALPSSGATARFRFEARIAAQLSHATRHIVRVTDYGEDEGLTYIVMELLEGETLEARLQRTGRLPLEAVSVLVAQAARGLEAAHAAGVMHRDLKPANIFLTTDEYGALVVKLLDFGIARTLHTHRVAPTFSTADGLVFGTPGYMSPEQANPVSRLDHRCDVWALATVAYEAMTGELPIAGDTNEELLRHVCEARTVPLRERGVDAPPGIHALFEKAFAQDVDDRFQTAQELSLRFDASLREGAAGTAGVAAAEPPQTPDASAPAVAAASVEAPPLPGGGRRRPHPSGTERVWFLAAAAAAVGIAAAAAGVWGHASGTEIRAIAPASAPAPGPAALPAVVSLAPAIGDSATPTSAPPPSPDLSATRTPPDALPTAGHPAAHEPGPPRVTALRPPSAPPTQPRSVPARDESHAPTRSTAPVSSTPKVADKSEVL